MITNFETITEELTAKELEIIPILVSGFNRYTKENPIKSPALIKNLNEYFVKNNIKNKIDGPRLRKCCNYIRSNAMLPLVATSNGYYVSSDKEEIKKQIKSLIERANSIMNCAKGLNKFT
jgi:hypothetical protein